MTNHYHPHSWDDLEGSALSDALKRYRGVAYVAPEIGVNFVKPWVIHIGDGDGQEDH